MQPTLQFPPSFPTAQATAQPDYSQLQTDYPTSPFLISKYGLMVLPSPFLVTVVLECMSHAPNATHPIPCPFLLVQLPPASQLKPLPSSKVSSGVLTICWPANSSQSFFNWLPIGPPNPFISPLLSPAWVPLECLVPRLLQQHHLKLPLGPGHAGLPGNVNADLLSKAGASLPTDAIPCPIPPVIAKVRYLQYHNWRRHISHTYLNCQVPKFSSEELFTPYSLWAFPSSLPWSPSSFIFISWQDQSEGEFCL